MNVAVEPLAALGSDWNDLSKRARTNNVFVTHAFQDTWWQHFQRSRESRVYVVRDGSGRAVGIVPLYTERRRLRWGTVRVLRNVGFGDVVNPDFLDALVEPGREIEVADALAPHLLGDSGWQFAELSDVAPAGSLVRIARRWEERAGLRLREEVRAVCPYLTLPPTFDAFLAGMGPHFRQQLRRYRRVIERDLKPEWRRVGVDLDVASGIAMLADLHQERMEATERGGNFRKDDYQAFHRALAERLALTGELYFWVLLIDGQPAATHYGFLHDGVYYGYQMGFRLRYAKWSPGHYMTGVVVEKLIAAGARELNLLRGTDDWKYRWTNQERTTVTLHAIRPGVVASTAWLRAQLSAPPALVLRLALGREAFDEWRAAWHTLRGADTTVD